MRRWGVVLEKCLSGKEARNLDITPKKEAFGNKWIVAHMNGFLVSKETVVLHQWETQTKFGVAKRVDKG